MNLALCYTYVSFEQGQVGKRIYIIVIVYHFLVNKMFCINNTIIYYNYVVCIARKPKYDAFNDIILLSYVKIS